MNPILSRYIECALLLVLSGSAHAGATFTPLGDLPGANSRSLAHGVSADGAVVVGLGRSASGSGASLDEAFRWTAVGGMVGLGDLPGGEFRSVALDVSANGAVVVGYSSSEASSRLFSEAFRWTAAGGMVGLGDLPGDLFISEARGVSADGAVIVGAGRSLSGNEAFRWTSGGMVGLGDLAGGSFESQANSVSADGAVVVGGGRSAFGSEAFRWTVSGGMVGLGDLAGGSFDSQANSVSADGAVVVGRGRSASGNEAFRWTAGSGMVGLGDLPGGGFGSVAYDVSADGSVIIGESESAAGYEAFVWTQANGMQRLVDVLVGSGATGLTGWFLTNAKAISADGHHIVGLSNKASGELEAWLASADPPSLGPQHPQPRPNLPPFQRVPSVSPVPSQPVSKNLVLIVHGWNSHPAEWADALREDIKRQIDQGPRDENEDWKVLVEDWSESANDCVLVHSPVVSCAEQAWAIAADLGDWVGDRLRQEKYNHIHFIAHSAGAQLVQSATVWLRDKSPEGEQPFIHTTFLDAYYPDGVPPYGGFANWAEHYVDKRGGTPVTPLERDSNLTLPLAFNFDITLLDKESGRFDAHSWPYRWYRDTVIKPEDWNYGWRASAERDSSRLPKHTDLGRGRECPVLTGNTVCEARTPASPTLRFSPVINSYDLTSRPVLITQSATGAVSLSTPQHIGLTAGSPVWVTFSADVVDAFDSIQFAYQFLSGADGLLSVFADDRLVFRADQRITFSGINQSGIVPVGDIRQGRHSISFRLDHFAESKPTVDISAIQLGIVGLVETTNVAPIASAGSDQAREMGSLVQLDGTTSTDPDQGPSPLVFVWSQISGPTIALVDSMTSRPRFVATSSGTYTFSLTVHDGQEFSAPAFHRVTATQPAATPPFVSPNPSPPPQGSGSGGGSLGLYELFVLAGMAVVGLRRRKLADRFFVCILIEFLQRVTRTQSRTAPGIRSRVGAASC